MLGVREEVFSEKMSFLRASWSQRGKPAQRAASVGSCELAATYSFGAIVPVKVTSTKSASFCPRQAQTVKPGVIMERISTMTPVDTLCF